MGPQGVPQLVGRTVCPLCLLNALGSPRRGWSLPLCREKSGCVGGWMKWRCERVLLAAVWALSKRFSQCSKTCMLICPKYSTSYSKLLVGVHVSLFCILMNTDLEKMLPGSSDKLHLLVLIVCSCFAQYLYSPSHRFCLFLVV